MTVWVLLADARDQLRIYEAVALPVETRRSRLVRFAQARVAWIERRQVFRSRDAAERVLALLELAR